MEELKPQESEALDILEAMLDVCDLDNPGPMFAGQHVRGGICKIMGDDAAKLRQYIANRRAALENDRYMEGVKYAIYEIFKEADIPGSQGIRDSGDTDDGMCARAAKRIRAELDAPENKAMTKADRIRSMSDEELAGFIQSNLPIFRTFGEQLDWLNQPYARKPEGSSTS